jgi:hypothetical protein
MCNNEKKYIGQCSNCLSWTNVIPIAQYLLDDQFMFDTKNKKCPACNSDYDCISKVLHKYENSNIDQNEEKFFVRNPKMIKKCPYDTDVDIINCPNFKEDRRDIEYPGLCLYEREGLNPGDYICIQELENEES